LKKERTLPGAGKIRHLPVSVFWPISSAQDTEVIIRGQKVLMLGFQQLSGFNQSPGNQEAVHAAVDKYGSGCAGSRFLNGTLDIHLELEEALARLVGKESVLLYSTGFSGQLRHHQRHGGARRIRDRRQGGSCQHYGRCLLSMGTSCVTTTMTWQALKLPEKNRSGGRKLLSWTGCSACPGHRAAHGNGRAC